MTQISDGGQTTRRVNNADKYASILPKSTHVAMQLELEQIEADTQIETEVCNNIYLFIFVTNVSLH